MCFSFHGKRVPHHHFFIKVPSIFCDVVCGIVNKLLLFFIHVFWVEVWAFHFYMSMVMLLVCFMLIISRCYGNTWVALK